MSDEDAWDVIARAPLAQLVVVAGDSPIATPVPLLRRGDGLVGHLARGNDVWQHTGPALAIFNGPDAPVSPRWYEDKITTGRVVPTWNYVTVQVRGRLVVHQDPAWLRDVVGKAL